MLPKQPLMVERLLFACSELLLEANTDSLMITRAQKVRHLATVTTPLGSLQLDNRQEYLASIGKVAPTRNA